MEKPSGYSPQVPKWDSGKKLLVVVFISRYYRPGGEPRSPGIAVVAHRPELALCWASMDEGPSAFRSWGCQVSGTDWWLPLTSSNPNYAHQFYLSQKLLNKSEEVIHILLFPEFIKIFHKKRCVSWVNMQLNAQWFP